MYIFIREDLSHAYQIVQAAHATHQTGIRFGSTEPPPNFVLIGVKDQVELEEVDFYLYCNEIDCVKFFEPDHNTGYTAIATKPLCGDDRKLFRKFNIYKGDNNE